MAWIKYNANPAGRQVGDCTVRAISKAMGRNWDETYSGLAIEGLIRANMPSANHVWGAYLKRHGFGRYIIPDNCPDCYTVNDFCRDHPKGMYILAVDGHVIAVQDGNFYDTWDSGNEIPIYYWQKEDE